MVTKVRDAQSQKLPKECYFRTVNQKFYIQVVVPLAFGEPLTYQISETQRSSIAVGHRVEVEIRNKHYAGIVWALDVTHDPDAYRPRPIVGILDEIPLVQAKHLEYWDWIAKYYMCTLGEVLLVSLPAGLRLDSETKITPTFEDLTTIEEEITDDEYLILEALSIRSALSMEEIRLILGRKTIIPMIRSLINKNLIAYQEEVQAKFRPKVTRILNLNPDFQLEDGQHKALDMVRKSQLQTQALGTILLLHQKMEDIVAEDVCNLANVGLPILQALQKKGIITLSKKTVSRLSNSDQDFSQLLPELSEIQLACKEEMKTHLAQGQTFLLHGVTGSGKTSIYMHLMAEALQAGKQVLFMLPEIALTTQMVDRLEQVFGNRLVVFHSKIGAYDRVEIWKAAAQDVRIFVTARSGVFLPFSNLGLIIVDEEHDASFKQQNPNPRYHARDLCRYLSAKGEIPLVLGSATPSLESLQQVKEKKMGYYHLHLRYGESVLPDIEIIDLVRERKINRLRSFLSVPLKNAIDQKLAAGEQVILFQNRRGYAPIQECLDCGTVQFCKKCDVALTYHKGFHELRCHYCGYRVVADKKCRSCGSDNLKDVGVGTEQIEEEIKRLYPTVTTLRMDTDTVKGKSSLQDIISQFESGRAKILIGTQMVSKGFDFEKLGLVGVIQSDGMLKIPDFRANERAYQLLTQIAGRAGRRGKKGQVLIQTYQPQHPIIEEVKAQEFRNFFRREMAERSSFRYPPFVKIIDIHFKHSKFDTLRDGVQYFAEAIRPQLGARVLGPSFPAIGRVRNQYLATITIKMERQMEVVTKIKSLLQQQKARTLSTPGLKSLRIDFDVDPY